MRIDLNIGSSNMLNSLSFLRCIELNDLDAHWEVPPFLLKMVKALFSIF